MKKFLLALGLVAFCSAPVLAMVTEDPTDPVATEEVKSVDDVEEEAAK